MTPDEKSRLNAATLTVGAAVVLIRREMRIFEEFIVADDMDSDRRAALLVMRPIFEAAKHLVDVHDLQVRSARAALTAVKTK